MLAILSAIEKKKQFATDYITQTQQQNPRFVIICHKNRILFIAVLMIY